MKQCAKPAGMVLSAAAIATTYTDPADAEPAILGIGHDITTIPGTTSTTVIGAIITYTTIPSGSPAPGPGWTPTVLSPAGYVEYSSVVVSPTTITNVAPATKLFVEGPITVTLSPRTETRSREPFVPARRHSRPLLPRRWS
jgi:hypothetical protein